MSNPLRKLFIAMGSLRDMKIKTAIEPRASWRDRFLEIAREVEAGRAPRALVVAAGWRQRPRITAAAAGRVRILAAGA